MSLSGTVFWLLADKNQFDNNKIIEWQCTETSTRNLVKDVKENELGQECPFNLETAVGREKEM